MSTYVFISSKWDRLLIRGPMSFNNSVATYIHTKKITQTRTNQNKHKYQRKHFRFVESVTLSTSFFYTMDFPSVFIGCRQTAENQTSRRRSRRLIRFLTVCLLNALFDFEYNRKFPPIIP